VQREPTKKPRGDKNLRPFPEQQIGGKNTGEPPPASLVA